MKCPSCKEPGHRVLETREVDDSTTRRRVACKNNHRWTTYERSDRASFDATRSVLETLAVVSNQAKSHATRSGPPRSARAAANTTRSVQTLPVALAVGGLGGLGGSLSGISSPSLPLEDQTQTQSQTGVEPDYPAAFLAEWNQTAKTGAKKKALAAWVKAGRPKFGASWQRWKNCAEWKQSWFNYPHVVTWLTDGRFQQDPAEAETKPAPARDTRCHFHRAFGTAGKRPPAGWFAECPECKHARAGGGSRVSEGATVRDLVAETEKRLAAQAKVTPATADELASLRRAEVKS